MIRKYIQLLSFTFLVVSCTRYIEFTPPYEGDKIVINGYLSPSEGAKIKISHSINLVGNYLWSDSLLVKDASASLFENGEKLIDLKYVGKGFYGIPDSTHLELLAGHKYKLLVHSELYGNAESEEITIPEMAEINDFKFGEIVEIYGQEHVLFSFSISEPSEKESYFLLDAVTKNNESLFFIRYPWKEGEIYFESCQATIGVLSIYSNECGFTNQEHNYALRHKYNVGTSSFYYEPIIIQIGTVSHEIYEYAKSYNLLEGVELGFAEPPILKSNIKGGYGLVYGSNILSFQIELP